MILEGSFLISRPTKLGLEDTPGKNFHLEASNDRAHLYTVDFSDRKLQIGLRD